MQSKYTKILVVLLVALGLANGTALAQSLKVKSAGSVQKGSSTQVTIAFTQPVEDASGTDKNNYTFPAGITVSGVSLINDLPAADALGIAENSPPSGRNQNNSVAVVTVDGLAPGSATQVTVKGVKDRANPATVIADTTVKFKASGYKWTETGQTGTAAGRGKTAGHVVSLADENGDIGFDIYSNGGTQWANYDEITFVYKELTGDFDFQARVEFVDFASRWGRSGAIAREDLNEGMANPPTTAEVTEASRYVSMHSNPVRAFNDAAAGMLAGNNGFESHIRTTVGAQTGSSGGGTPLYPNAWIRIQRTGDTLFTFRGEDGDNWEQVAERTVDDPGPWNPKLFVGPSYSPETQDGNISPANGAEVKARLFLAQIRFGKVTTPYVKSFAGNPGGFVMELADGQTAVNKDSIQVKFDGATATASVNKPDTTTTITYSAPAPLAAGSVHTVQVVFADNGTPPTSQTIDRSFTVQQYVAMPTDFAAPAGSVDKSKVGFRVRTHQAATGQPNNNARTEQQLAGELGDNQGTPGPEPDGSYLDGTVPDYWDSGGTGNFDTGASFPGVAGNNLAMEVLTYLEFTKTGIVTMGVNSDDGFTVSTGKDFRDRFDKGTLLGEFNGGRGVADTTFVFLISQPGIYPFRLTWEQGGGGAACEWFTVVDGVRILINDAANADATLAYYQGPVRGPAYVKSVRPGVGVSVGSSDATKVEVMLEDADTKVAQASVKMKYDGADVSPSVNKAGSTTTVTYTPAGGITTGTHNVELSYDHAASPATTRTVSFSFTVKPSPSDLPAVGSFWIEGEDFDSDGGTTLPEASVMPYGGGAYDTLGAIEAVDYVNDDANDSDVYRTEKPENLADENEVNMNDNLGGRWGSERPGGFTVTTNYKIGWVSDADWCNYTRTIPNGFYNAYAALSYDGTDAGQLRGTLFKVTSGVGTKNQTVERLGGFNAPGSGGWGPNDLVIMKAADGSDAVVKLEGKTTLRFNMGSGDFDWFVLTPAAGATTQLKSATPAAGAMASLNAKIELEVEDLNNQVVQSSVKLEYDGQDVTAQATITQARPLTKASYTPPALLQAGSAHSYKVTWSDNATPPNVKTFTANFTGYPVGAAGMFAIEAEDFNYDDGQTKAVASQMPYLGGAYGGLGATEGVDYNNNDDNSSDVYRTEKDENGENEVNMNDNLGGQLGRQRGLWDVTVNYKLGWVEGGSWQNYTRTFPAADYEVWAALSYDGRDAGQLQGSLQRVTSPANVADQTLENLGDFNAPGSGGWGRNDLVKMTGAPVHLEGTQTLRFNLGSGDFDYLLLVPGGAPPPPSFSLPTLDANNLVLVWSGGGTLQSSTDLKSWSAVAGAATGVKVPILAGAHVYYRVVR